MLQMLMSSLDGKRVIILSDCELLLTISRVINEAHVNYDMADTYTVTSAVLLRSAPGHPQLRSSSMVSCVMTKLRHSPIIINHPPVTITTIPDNKQITICSLDTLRF